MYRNGLMKQAELVRKLRRLARRTGTDFHTLKTQGKGSHITLFYGDRRSTCPQGELKTGTFHKVLRDLGLRDRDLP